MRVWESACSALSIAGLEVLGFELRVVHLFTARCLLGSVRAMIDCCLLVGGSCWVLSGSVLICGLFLRDQ